MKRGYLSILLTIIVTCVSAQDKSEYRLYASGGLVLNAPAHLKIKDFGGYTKTISARFGSESFVLPPYWDFRFERRKNERAFGLRLTHHKLILNNRPPEIDRFEISHGFNMLDAYYVWDKGSYDILVGAGITLGHPEGRINGESVRGDKGVWFDKGYFIGLPNIEVSMSRSYELMDWLSLVGEFRVVGSYGNFPLRGVNGSNGTVTVANLSFHFMVGFFLKQ